GHDYAEMFSLTTVEQYPLDQGVEATRLLLSMIEGTDEPARRTEAVTRLVVRASTAPPRSA
ncbi:MAG: transcriptional regulator, partial [Microbacterium sp.]|nr:transcriptional regulator [Microbacterium sp.]